MMAPRRPSDPRAVIVYVLTFLIICGAIGIITFLVWKGGDCVALM